MPAKPSYSGRLKDAAASLRRIDSAWIDRRQLEELLGVSKTVAWRVLKKCGLQPGPGGALVCPREQLIVWLEELEKDGDVHEREIERLGRLETLLDGVRPAVMANMTNVARDAKALEILSASFAKLPPNVRLLKKSLHIEFTGPEEFLQAVGSLVYALHNDYESIQAFLA